MKYRKKPVVIEAFQWLMDWPPAWFFDIGANFTEEGMVIPTLEGDMLARPGDYIIKGIKGEFYPCKPDVFVATYEPVEPGVAR